MSDNISKKLLLSNNKKTNTFWVSLGTLMFGALLLAYLYEDKVVSWSPSTLIIIDLVLTIVMGVLTFFIAKNTYIVFEDDKFEILHGKKTTPYFYDDFLGSDVTRHSYNGIYTGTSRVINVKNLKGKKTSINCGGIGRDAFSEIVAYIGKSSFQKHQDSDVPADYFNQSRSFTVPKDEIIEANKKHTLLFTILTAVAGVALLVVWFVAGYADTKNGSHDTSYYVMLVIIALIMAWVAVYFLIKFRRNYKRVLTIPERITIDDSTISIDGKTYDLAYIKNVSMVPGNYKILTRDLVIITTDGSKTLYSFGEGGGSEKRTYSDYESLYQTIKFWCLLKGVNYTSILG